MKGIDGAGMFGPTGRPPGDGRPHLNTSTKGKARCQHAAAPLAELQKHAYMLIQETWPHAVPHAYQKRLVVVR